jgi:hypothetical protein
MFANFRDTVSEISDFSLRTAATDGNIENRHQMFFGKKILAALL